MGYPAAHYVYNQDTSNLPPPPPYTAEATGIAPPRYSEQPAPPAAYPQPGGYPASQQPGYPPNAPQDGGCAPNNAAPPAYQPTDPLQQQPEARTDHTAPPPHVPGGATNDASGSEPYYVLNDGTVYYPSTGAVYPAPARGHNDLATPPFPAPPPPAPNAAAGSSANAAAESNITAASCMLPTSPHHIHVPPPPMYTPPPGTPVH
jgi:hypothetical protein